MKPYSCVDQAQYDEDMLVLRAYLKAKLITQTDYDAQRDVVSLSSFVLNWQAHHNFVAVVVVAYVDATRITRRCRLWLSGHKLYAQQRMARDSVEKEGEGLMHIIFSKPFYCTNKKHCFLKY